ncbi:MAG TPA: hydroxymethylglutaryl-CoA synthase family protein [bacterium]|nr:hydroxymethylglutaryl-CoA synthase family protein [bacterium]
MNLKTPKVGISEIAVSIPKWFISVEKIAEKSQLPLEYVNGGLGLIQARIPYNTSLEQLIIKALKKINHKDVDRFFIATESDYDISKAEIGIKTIKNLNITVVPFQLKFACLSGVQALLLACEYAIAHDKPAVVIAADRSVYEDKKAEVTQGSGVVAMRIEQNPKLLTLDFKNVGQYSKDINDFRVPISTAPFPQVNGPLTKPAFIRCIIKAVNDYKTKNQECSSIVKTADHIVMHTPFPKMIVWASAALWHYEKYKSGLELLKECLTNPQSFIKFKEILDRTRKALDFQTFFKQKVKSGLRYNPYIGNCYTVSVFISLISTLEQAKANQNICIIGYGGGSGSLALMGKSVNSNFQSDLIHQIKNGNELTSQQYQKWRTDTVKKIRNQL